MGIKLSLEKVGNCYLYFTSHDSDEAAHSHAHPSSTMPEDGSAKIWIYRDGHTKVDHKGVVSDRSLNEICKYIKGNYIYMFERWEEHFKNLEIYGEPGKDFTIKDNKVIEIIVCDETIDIEQISLYHFGDHKYSDEQTQAEVVEKLLDAGYHWNDIGKVTSVTQERYEKLKTDSIEEFPKDVLFFIELSIEDFRGFHNKTYGYKKMSKYLTKGLEDVLIPHFIVDKIVKRLSLPELWIMRCEVLNTDDVCDVGLSENDVTVLKECVQRIIDEEMTEFNESNENIPYDKSTHFQI